MIGYQITTTGIYNSQGNICWEPPYLDWLLADNPQDNVCLFYDLDASVAALLSLIGISPQEGAQLRDKGKLYLAPYRLTYYPRKFFSIDKGFGPGHQYRNFSNAGQYTDVHFDPKESLAKTIGKAKEAEGLGQEVAQVSRGLGLTAQTLTSPISAFEKVYMASLNVPTIDDLPVEAAEMAYESVKGNWLEAYQVGYWPEAFDYDINGAYASELSRLLDTRRGHWLNRPTPPPEAVYGFARGLLTTSAEFHPFLVNLEHDVTYTPTGSWATTLTLQEIQFLVTHELGTFDIFEGWWWMPQGQQWEMLKGVVSWLWTKRGASEGLAGDIIKRILAGLWGKTLETRGKDGQEEFGPYFNPVYGAIVEANTRLRVAGACLEHGVQPLHVAVDGMILDRELPLETSEQLGAWRLSHKGQCIIVSSGIVGFEGKQGAEEFSLRYSWLEEQLRAYPKRKEYKMRKWSPCTLARALNTDFGQLGQLEKVTRSVYIGREPKRMWLDATGYPKTGGDLLAKQIASQPWDYTLLAGAKALTTAPEGGREP